MCEERDVTKRISNIEYELHDTLRKTPNETSHNPPRCGLRNCLINSYEVGWLIKSWPDWLVKGTPRPSKDRVTFTTLKGYHKDSSLLPSGLLGPVTIRTGAWVEVK